MIYLLNLYDKAEKEEFSMEEKKNLKDFAEHIRKEALESKINRR